MGKKAKNFVAATEMYDKALPVSLEEGIRILKSFPVRKFDESVELSFFLGIDGRQADQTLRGTVMLPHGTGKDIRVVVITQGDLVAEAEAGSRQAAAAFKDAGGPKLLGVDP